MARLYLHVGQQEIERQTIADLLQSSRAQLLNHGIEIVTTGPAQEDSSPLRRDWLKTPATVSPDLFVSDPDLYRHFGDGEFIAELNHHANTTGREVCVLAVLRNPVDTQYVRYLRRPANDPQQLSLADYFDNDAIADQKRLLELTQTMLRTCVQHDYRLTVVNLSNIDTSNRSATAEMVGDFVGLAPVGADTVIGRPHGRESTAFEHGVRQTLGRILEATDDQTINTALARVAAAIPGFDADLEKSIALAEAASSVNRFATALFEQVSEINEHLSPCQHLRASVLDSQGGEFQKLDQDYARLLVMTITRAVLDLLSRNLDGEQRLNCLEILCQRLSSKHASADLKHWNAYGQALRAIGDPRAASVGEIVREIRAQAEAPALPSISKPSHRLSVDSRERAVNREKIFLHVGHSKTGSSFLQAILAQNHARLSQLGIHYPMLERDHARATRGGVTSGNRRVINDPEQLGKALSYPGAVLLSNESMWRKFADARFVDTIAEAAARSDRTVAIFLCLRNPIEHNQSRFMQLSQAGMSSMTISEFFQGKAVYDQLDLFASVLGIIDLCDQLGFELAIYNYSIIRSHLLPTFCRFLGVDEVDTLVSDNAMTRVNRSLNTVELGARRALNNLFQDCPQLPQDRNYLRELVDATPELNFPLPRPTAEALDRFLVGIGQDLDATNARLPAQAQYERQHLTLSGVGAQQGSDSSADEPTTIRYGDVLTQTIALLALNELTPATNAHNAELLQQVRERIGVRITD